MRMPRKKSYEKRRFVGVIKKSQKNGKIVPEYQLFLKSYSNSDLSYARRVLVMRLATVMGPTPPGTGVIKDAF